MSTPSVNRQPFYWLNQNSRKFLERGYLTEGVTPEQRIRFMADHAEKLLNKPGFADKFYDYVAKGYYSLATPVMSNFGLERGLPISCFSVHISDSMSHILYAQAEVG